MNDLRFNDIIRVSNATRDSLLLFFSCVAHWCALAFLFCVGFAMVSQQNTNEPKHATNTLPLLEMTMNCALCVIVFALSVHLFFIASTFHSRFAIRNVQRFYLNLTFSRFPNQTSLFFTWIIRSFFFTRAHSALSKLSNKNAYLCLSVCILMIADVRIFVHAYMRIAESSSSSFKHTHTRAWIEWKIHWLRKMILSSRESKPKKILWATAHELKHI